MEDLIAVLEDLEAASRGRDALGLSTSPAPVVIGHSMGAATAMVAVGRRPDLVTGVVLGQRGHNPLTAGLYAGLQLADHAARSAMRQTP